MEQRKRVLHTVDGTSRHSCLSENVNLSLRPPPSENSYTLRVTSCPRIPVHSVLVATGVLQTLPYCTLERPAVAGRRNHYGRGHRGAALHDEGAAPHCFQSERLDCHTQGEEEQRRLNLERKCQTFLWGLVFVPVIMDTWMLQYAIA